MISTYSIVILIETIVYIAEHEYLHFLYFNKPQNILTTPTHACVYGVWCMVCGAWRVCACVHACVCACVHACVSECMHVCKCKYICACMHACIHACLHACMFAFMHGCSYVHACMRACVCCSSLSLKLFS